MVFRCVGILVFRQQENQNADTQMNWRDLKTNKYG